MLLSKPALVQTDADTMAEVRAAVTLLVHVVASRHVVGECASLLDEMEHYQGQCWTHEEWRYQQVKRLRLNPSGGSTDIKASRMGLRTPGLTRGSSLPQPLRDGITSGRGGDDGSARPPKWKGKIKGLSAGPGAQDEDLLGLGSQVLRLDVSGSTLSVCVVGGAGSKAARGLGVKPRSRRGGTSTPRPAVSRACLSSADSYAEAILAKAQSRSQLAVEFAPPVAAPVSDPADRLLQRRLALLGTLQLETIKLERKQRKEGGGAGFYKLEGVDTKGVGARSLASAMARWH